MTDFLEHYNAKVFCPPVVVLSDYAEAQQNTLINDDLKNVVNTNDARGAKVVFNCGYGVLRVDQWINKNSAFSEPLRETAA